jgi:hypothetical protein
MDMTTGEKWVKLVDDDDDGDAYDYQFNGGERSNAENIEAKGSSVSVAVIQDDGTVQMDRSSSTATKKNYDFEMMHRTLSKLPPEEQKRIGGLPELPDAGSEKDGTSTVTITNKEREMFEKRMLEIWQRRQAELAALQESLVNLPDLLKERIKSIDLYLKDPVEGRRSIGLDVDDVSEGIVTDILSVLEDLEFHLTDVDMARDFHTMGGWSMLASLVANSSHLSRNEPTINQTVSDGGDSAQLLSTIGTDDRSKIMKIQALASWCMGTTVKNTGEFSPYAIEPILLVSNKDSSMSSPPIQTTPIDLLIDLFVETNLEGGDSNSREVRNLQTKTLYAISSMLRGNRAAQAHAARNTDGLTRLGMKYRTLVTRNDNKGGYEINSADIKLLTRLASLSSDIIQDVLLHPDLADDDVNKLIIDAMSTGDWCDTTCHVVLSDSVIPMNARETLIKSMTVLAPHCNWSCESTSLRKALEGILTIFLQNEAQYDTDHVADMKSTIDEALAVVSSSA